MIFLSQINCQKRYDSVLEELWIEKKSKKMRKEKNWVKGLNPTLKTWSSLLRSDKCEYSAYQLFIML